jgi:hypothetical protein
LYILIFRFFDNRRKDRRLWTEWQQALPELNPLLISSWIKFWFVTVVRKYFNCDTFSNELFAVFMYQIWPAFWWRDSNIFLVFTAFSSRPSSLLATIKVSVFFFILSMLSPSRFTS